MARRPALVLIEGEAGIGKTRLVQEFLAPPREGHLVAVCPPFRQACTLGAITDAVHQAADSLRDLRLSALAGALRPLFPEWAADLPAAPDRAEDATAARYRLYRALAELLERLRVELLVAEDAQWADEATLEFLLFLMSRQPQPVSLVVTYRPEDVQAESLLPRLSARLQSATTGLRLTLGPLDVTGTARLMSSMLGGEPVSHEFAALVHWRTEGVPLAVEESVRLMGDRTDVTRRDGGWVRRHLEDIRVPPTIRDAVLERAARLGPSARAVLEAAAVMAEPAGEGTLAAVAGLSAAQAAGGLCVALECGLLGEDGRGLVSFRHVLAAQAVYEAMRGPRRRVLHLRAGRAMEAVSPEPLAQLARHFRAAGDTGKWCRYAEWAADRAFASGDEASVTALLHSLVVHAGLPAAEMVRLVKKMPLGSSANDARLPGLARALWSALGAEGLSPGDEADVRMQLGRILMVMDEFDAARAELQLAVPHLAHDPVEHAQAMIMLGWPRGMAWPRSAHLRWLRRAGTVALPPGAAAARIRLAVDRVTGLLLLGEEAGWAEAARITTGDWASPQERNQVARGYMNIAEMAVIWGRYADARRRLAQALELTERHHYRRYRDGVLAVAAHMDWFTGMWNGLADRAAVLADSTDQPVTTRLRALLVSGLLHAATGDRPHAEECLHHVLEEALRRGIVECAIEPAAALAQLHLADGGTAQALAVTEEPARIVASKGIWVWATELAPARVSALAADGQIGDAAELVAAFACGLRGRGAPAPKASLISCRAILAQARGNFARAAALFARAAAAWDELPRPYDALLAREHNARSLLASGRPEDGLALLRQVYGGLSRLSAKSDTLRVMGMLRRHGATLKRPWPGRPSYGEQLSPRELEVVRLVAAGQTNREIARTLFLSAKTVACHVDSAKRKLKATSRTALAVSAVNAGMVPPGAIGPEAD